MGTQIHRIADSSCWWLGDWLIYGERNYPDRYRNAITQTGLDYQTLRNYAWVARAFEMSRRRDSLSFQHHAELAALPTNQQDVWLTRAAEFCWSRRKLREELKAERKDKRDSDDASGISVEVRADALQHRRWLDAADKEQVSLTNWISATLDEAAGSVLDAPAIS